MDTEWVHEEPIRLSVILPALDELPNLRNLIPRLLTTCGELKNVQAEILVVLATTAAPSELAEIEAMGASVVVRQPSNSFGDAMRSGLMAVSSESEYVITMDADGSHDPATIGRLLEARNGAHVVVASRYTSGGITDNSLPLRAMSRLLNWVYALVLHINCRDVSTNYKLYRCRDLVQLRLTCKEFDIVEEILFQVKRLHGKLFVVREVPDHFYNRNFGETKRDLKPFIASYVLTLLRLRWSSRRRVS